MQEGGTRPHHPQTSHWRRCTVVPQGREEQKLVPGSFTSESEQQEWGWTRLVLALPVAPTPNECKPGIKAPHRRPLLPCASQGGLGRPAAPPLPALLGSIRTQTDAGPSVSHVRNPGFLFIHCNFSRFPETPTHLQLKLRCCHLQFTM